MKKLIAALTFGILVSAPAFANFEEAEAGVWGIKELKLAQEASLLAFKEKLGEDALKTVVGFGIERNIQGTAGNATVTYKKGDEKITLKFFCHVHEGEDIDCH